MADVSVKLVDYFSSCDRSRCPKDSKAFSMSSSQALNTLTLHSLVLPANRPCPILFEQGSIVSLKHVCVLICYALVGLACFSSRFASPYGNIYNRVGLVTFGPSEGWRCNGIACLPIERAWPTVLRCLFLTVCMKHKTSVAVGFCPRCNDEFLKCVCWTLVMIGSPCS